MKYLSILAIVIFLSGCAGMATPPPSICDTPEATGSVLCTISSELGVQLEDLDLIFKIAALELLDRDGKDRVLEVYSDARIYLNAARSYAGFVVFIEEKTELTGTTALLIKRHLDRMRGDARIISAFDLKQLLYHIETTEAILKDG